MIALTGPEEFAILIQLVIVLLVIRRSYAMAQGVPYSLARLAALPALIIVLWGLSELESILLTPWGLPYLIALDVVILVGSSFAFAPVAQRATQVTLDSSAVGTYRIGFSITALFIVAFIARLAVAILLFPAALEFGAPPGGYPPMAQQLVLGLIDALFSLSAGLLVGRSVGVHRRWEAAVAHRQGADRR
jgi:hypothetical protein